MASNGLKALFYIFKEFRGTFFALLRTLPTAKKVPFSRSWEHRFQLQKKYLFAPFMRSLETEKKVPLLRFKTSFGKVRNGWRADNIDVKISFNRKLKIPDFFFKKRYLFLTFNLNDKHRQKRQQFCILFYGKWMQKLVFLLFSTSRVDLL